MDLDHVTLVVRDIERSRRFYSEALGVQAGEPKDISGRLIEKVTGIDRVKIRFCVLKMQGTVVELAQLDPAQGPFRDFRHVAFTVDDVDSVYDKVKEHAISEPVTLKSDDPMLDGKRFFYFRDPDSNLVEVLKRGSYRQ